MESFREYWIKNMVCRRCLKVIKQELEEINVQVLSLELGKPTVLSSSVSDGQIDNQIKEALYANGSQIAISEEEMLIEEVKIILIELTKELPIHLKVKTSELLASKLQRDYKILSKMFSKNESTTIEQYFIKLKIEKVKELIQLQEYTFSEIAYLLDYSSLNHLSRQFKSVSGKNMTDYRSLENWKRNFHDEII